MDKSKSYADVSTPNKYKNVANDWPDLKNQQKSKIKRKEIAESTSGSNSHQLNALTNVMERLSTDDVDRNSELTKTDKSKDEIRAERQLRRKSKKIEKNEKCFQEKLARIREPKSQKVQVVDRTVLETYLTSQKVSPFTDRQQSKSKKHSAVRVDLLDLINTKVVKPVDRSFIHSKQTSKLTSSTQRHKGKKSEVAKKKYVSQLKRSILQSRLLRNQIKMEVKEDASAEGLDWNSVEPQSGNSTEVKIDEGLPHLEPPQCSNKESEETVSTLPSHESSGVKFSRKFRPYCDNRTTSELCSLTETVLRDVFRFQDRAYNKNEIKARSNRRYVVGFKESMRQLDIGKVKLLIIAPDLEQSEAGGVTEVIEEMKMKCKNTKVPYVFSLKRRQLGYVLLKKVPVSCVGILNYQGSEESSQKLLLLIQEEKLRFRSAVCPSEVKINS